MLLPLPVTVLEVFMCKCPQLVCQDLLDVVHSSRMMTFEVEFEFWEKEEVTRTHIRWVWGLQNHWNTHFGQKFVHGDGSVTGSVARTQHSGVDNLWPDTNPFSELFTDFTIVLFIKCLSLRHEFLMNNTLTVEKTNKHGFDFWFAHSCFLQAWWVACVPLQN